MSNLGNLADEADQQAYNRATNTLLPQRVEQAREVFFVFRERQKEEGNNRVALSIQTDL